MRPHLDHGDVIFDKAYNNSFQQRLESLQYKASLAIIGPIKGSSTEKLYQELGLESLQTVKIDDGFENFQSFTKFLKNSPQNIYMT